MVHEQRLRGGGDCTLYSWGALKGPEDVDFGELAENGCPGRCSYIACESRRHPTTRSGGIQLNLALQRVLG
jgi:hypothetical protein